MIICNPIDPGFTSGGLVKIENDSFPWFFLNNIFCCCALNLNFYEFMDDW